MMEKLTKKEINKKGKPNPIFKDLPEELKDPKNFKKIEKKLIAVVFSDHKHTSIKTYMKCKRCQDKFQKRHQMIRELGFKDYEQYTLWRKVMTIINNKQSFQVR